MLNYGEKTSLSAWDGAKSASRYNGQLYNFVGGRRDDVHLFSISSIFAAMFRMVSKCWLLENIIILIGTWTILSSFKEPLHGNVSSTALGLHCHYIWRSKLCITMKKLKPFWGNIYYHVHCVLATPFSINIELIFNDSCRNRGEHFKRVENKNWKELFWKQTKVWDDKRLSESPGPWNWKPGKTWRWSEIENVIFYICTELHNYHKSQFQKMM